MAKHRRTPYWTPSLILGSFLCGMLLALGHHLFYNSLANKPTQTGDRTFGDTRIPGQQFNIAVGTTFAFLVKAAYASVIGTAYYQVFWAATRRASETRTPSTLGRLDAAFSGPTKVFSLIKVPAWCTYPSLFFMAISVWLIPIASIITPATLSVELRQNIPNKIMQHIPQIDFFNLNFLASMPASVGTIQISLYYTYDGPSEIVKRIAVSVAAQKAIAPITAPSPNSTWALDFRGPSLKCGPVTTDQSLQFRRNIAQYTVEATANCESPACFLSWFSRYSLSTNDSTKEPYLPSAQSNTSTLMWPDPTTIFKLGLGNLTNIEQNSTFYIATLPHMLDVETFTLSVEPKACLIGDSNQPPVTAENPLGVVGNNITILQCQLYNSTYHTTFNYENGVQSVAIDVEMDDAVPIINLVRGPGEPGGGCGTLNEVGATPADVNSNSSDGKPCDYDASLLSQLSYQAVLDAFTSLITGNITLAGDFAGVDPFGNTLGLSDSTGLRSTSLLETKELSFLTDYTMHMNGSALRPDLQMSLSVTNVSEVSGMSRLEQPTSPQLLQDAIEEMFRNITVSLMSQSALQPNYSSHTAPAKTEVTQFLVQTVYVYAATKLWIAYGIATLIALASGVVGLLTISVNGASYDGSFSTVFRIARAAELSVAIEESDRNGKSPLPEYLARASVLIVGATNRASAEAGRTKGESGDSLPVNASTGLLK